MTQTSYKGIDYGLGQSNVDQKTGIRYGVVSINSLNLDCVYDGSFDEDYGKPTCPKCGNTVTDELPDGWREMELESYMGHGCDDFVCVDCKLLLDSSDVYSEEMLGMSYNKDGYELSSAFDNTEIFITKSPYYTHAQFCSPCAPGAGNINHPCADGPKTYCLDGDWFEDEKAPYPVYRVSDDTLVEDSALPPSASQAKA
jgi:hypothetical protein